MSRRLPPLLLTAWLIWAGGCATVPEPAVSLVDIAFTEATAFETGAVFTVRIQNPSPSPLRFKGAVHRVTLDGADVGGGVTGESVEVPPFGEVTQDVTVRFSNLLLATRLQGMLQSRSVSYRLDSTLHPAAGSSSVTVRKQGRLALDDFAPPHADNP